MGPYILCALTDIRSMWSAFTSMGILPNAWAASQWNRTPRLAAEGADFAHRLDHADLVVGVHHAHQHGLGADGVAQAVEIEQAVGRGGQDGGAAAEALQVADGIEHGFVLGGHGDDVVARGRGTASAARP